MNSVVVTLGADLRLKLRDIREPLADQIVDELTLPNEDKEDQLRRRVWGAENLPDEFILASLDDDERTLVMPRGYGNRLRELLVDEGHSVVLNDNRRWVRAGMSYEWRGDDLREHQPRAVRRICAFDEGIYVAPTGSGKTVAELRAMCELQPEYSLIYVNQAGLVDQWVNRIARFTTLMKNSVGRIAEGKFSIGPITVATIQSVWSRLKRGELPDEYFELFSFVLLDECHHATAMTFNEIMQRHTAKHRKGTSATPAKTGDFALAEATLGPIVWEDDYNELVELGILHRPFVEIVNTGFDCVYWGDHHVEADERCEVPGCRLSGRKEHGHRNNYNKVLADLVRDPTRNFIIAGKVEEHLGHTQLIVSSQTTQLEAIYEAMQSSLFAITQEAEIFMLTGAVKGKKREEMIEKIENTPGVVVLSTVAKEGTDIPIVSRVHMPFPGKNVDAFKQVIGRGLRIAEGKEDAGIVDYRDEHPMFKKQFAGRVHRLYTPMGFEVQR